MSQVMNGSIDQEHSEYYQIRIKGHLGPEWKDWFDGLDIISDDAVETLLVGRVIDQAALFGLISKIRDAGLTLVSVVPLKSASNQE